MFLHLIFTPAGVVAMSPILQMRDQMFKEVLPGHSVSMQDHSFYHKGVRVYSRANYECPLPRNTDSGYSRYLMQDGDSFMKYL